MAEASHKMANGSLDQRITYSGHDEIGMLSKSFNSMAGDLSALIDSLKQKEISLQKAYDELIETQVQLVQSEKMAAIGELAASVVHEMRNPLSSVKLNFQIIGRSLDRKGPLHEHYSIGLEQIAQLEKMLSSLLDYSKPISVTKIPFRIETVIAESLQQLQSFTDGVSIELNTDGSFSDVVGDSEQIRQVLVNVIKNAIESAGPKGKVEVSIKAAGEDGRKGILVEVFDNGPGISQQDIKRIFQPFFTTKEKGTGLGLSIVKKIMEAHGFGISVSSEEGAGTVVACTCRVLKMKKILLIDDEHSLVRTLELYFRSKGYDVLAAFDAREGLSLWREHDPDFVLLDVQLPGMDGTQALAVAKDENLSGDVIMITAFQDMEATLSAIQHGAVDYLYKPLDLDTLDVLLEKILIRRKEREKIERLSHVISESFKPNQIIGKSKATLEVLKDIARVAPTPVTVLIEGETGTGKNWLPGPFTSSGRLTSRLWRSTAPPL